MAKKWIFAAEDKDSDITDFKSDSKDPPRALDGKLADALGRPSKGEPARRIALEVGEGRAVSRLAVRAADAVDDIQGVRLERDDATTDQIAHGHLERMTFSGKGKHPEPFVNSWDALMITFKKKPGPTSTAR